MELHKRPRMGGKLPLWGGGVFALPVILFIVCAIVTGLPTHTIVNSDIFVFQYVMTMLTIVSIPALLWYVRKERFKKDGMYKLALILRLAFFLILTLVDIAAYFAIPNIAFFYLATITYLSMFFARQ